MNIFDRITKSPFWNAVTHLSFGQVVAQIINLACTPILSRVYSDFDFGELGVIVSLASLINGCVCLGINSAIMLEKDEDAAKDIFYVSQNIQIFLSFLFVTVLVAVSSFTKVVNSELPSLIALLLIFLYLFANIRNTLLSIYLNRMKKNKILLLVPIINAVCNLLIALPFGIFGWNAYGLIVSTIIAFLTSNILMNVHAQVGFKWVGISVYTKVLKKYKELLLFQYPSNLVTTVSTQAPNQVLSNSFGNASLGSYSMCNKIFHIPFSMLATPIQTIFFRTSSEMADNLDRLSDFTLSLIKKILIVAFVPVLITCFWGEEIFVFVLGKDWAQAGLFASVLVLQYVFSFANNCITYCRVSIGKTKINLYMSIANLILIVSAIFVGAFIFKKLFVTIVLYGIVNTVYGILNIFITFLCLHKNACKFLMISSVYSVVCLGLVLIKWFII